MLCTQGVQDIGGQTIVKKESKQIVAVMSSGLKPYLYFVLRCGTLSDSLQQTVKTVHVVRDRKHIRQDFTLGANDKAIVLIL